MIYTCTLTKAGSVAVRSTDGETLDQVEYDSRDEVIHSQTSRSEQWAVALAKDKRNRMEAA